MEERWIPKAKMGEWFSGGKWGKNRKRRKILGRVQQGGTLKEFKSSDAEPGNVVLSFGSCLRDFTSNRNGFSSFGCCLVSIAFLLGVTGRDFTASQR